MKFLVLFAIVASTRAIPILPTLLSTGTSIQSSSQDALGNYNFGYTEGGATGGTFRKEAGDIAGNKIGSYGLTVADGRQRVVNYVADGAGFRATVSTNEPGVDPSKDPAAVTINKGAAPLAYSAFGFGAPLSVVAPGVAIANSPLLASSYSVPITHAGLGLIL